jgi:hypothetical protein
MKQVQVQDRTEIEKLILCTTYLQEIVIID